MLACLTVTKYATFGLMTQYCIQWTGEGLLKYAALSQFGGKTWKWHNPQAVEGRVRSSGFLILTAILGSENGDGFISCWQPTWKNVAVLSI